MTKGRLLVALLLVANQATAQESIGLHQALEAASASNMRLLRTGVDVASADAEIVKSTGSFDWVVKGQAGILKTASEFYPFTEDRSLTVGIEKKLPWNGTIGLTGTSVQRERDLGLSSIMTNVIAVQLTLNQPLLRGFGTKAAHSELWQARIQHSVEVLERRAVASEVVRDIVLGYWELAYATQAIELRRESVLLARELLRMVEEQIAIGRLAPSDLAGVKRAISEREAEVVVAEEEAERLSIQLRRAIGLPINEIALSASDVPSRGEGEPSDFDRLVERAKRMNPSLVAARQAGEKAAISVDVTRNGLLPQLDFSGAFGPTSRASSRDQPPANLQDAARELGRFRQFAYSATLTFSLPLGNDQARGAHELAEAERRRAQLSAEDIEQQITEAVAIAVSQVRSAAQREILSGQAATFVDESFQAEKGRFAVGKATHYNVLERQDELRAAKLRHVRASVDYLGAMARLEAVTGDILDRHHVSLRDRPTAK